MVCVGSTLRGDVVFKLAPAAPGADPRGAGGVGLLTPAALEKEKSKTIPIPGASHGTCNLTRERQVRGLLRANRKKSKFRPAKWRGFSAPDGNLGMLIEHETNEDRPGR